MPLPTIRMPEPWIVHHAGCVTSTGRILDVASGGGRHARFFLGRGRAVTALDIDTQRLHDIVTHPALEVIAADLECAPWPLLGRSFAAVVVVNYLWRPLLPTLVASVASGGVLLFDTFASGQARFGRPRNPDFLLLPDELLEAVQGKLTVHAYEYGEVTRPDGTHAMRQRICAIRTAT